MGRVGLVKNVRLQNRFILWSRTLNILQNNVWLLFKAFQKVRCLRYHLNPFRSLTNLYCSKLTELRTGVAMKWVEMMFEILDSVNKVYTASIDYPVNLVNLS